jgi:Holliday junction resolvase-like predicted endonuclease
MESREGHGYGVLREMTLPRAAAQALQVLTYCSIVTAIYWERDHRTMNALVIRFLLGIGLPGLLVSPGVAEDLVFIKTSNTPSGHVEVHIASASSNYQRKIVETATGFGNENDGVWELLPNRDLVFIKTGNTPNGHVEVHIASASSNYQQKVIETATTFGSENDGVWELLPNRDLVFIKTGNTPSGHVEIHIASASSNYQQRIVETTTTFGNENDGVWQLLPNRDLAFIKISNTANGHVEVHIASASSNYQQRIVETATTFGSEIDGVWKLLPNGDLVFIKTENTPNGHVEVHIASASSNYQHRIIETATSFGDEYDGSWSIVDTPDPSNLSDQDHLNLYYECMASRPVDLLGFANLVAGMFAGDPGALIQPFVDGYKNGQGCRAFLTSAQQQQQDANQLKSNIDNGAGVSGHQGVYTH